MSVNNSDTADVVRKAAARHYGLPLLPHPTQDERDPLRWPRGLKLAALCATAFVNFTANFAGAGLSVAIPVLEAQFHKTPNQVNSLLTVGLIMMDCLTSGADCPLVQLSASRGW
jgi:hypothetical protein